MKETREKREIESRGVKFIGSTVKGLQNAMGIRGRRFLQVSELGRVHGGINLMGDVMRACQAKEVSTWKKREHKKCDVFRDPQRVPFGWEIGSTGEQWERWQVAGRS